MMPSVLKALFNTILGFYAMDVPDGVYFISACCTVWINLQQAVSNNWRFKFDFVMCIILCICNRVHHMPEMLSYKHGAVTWITDYLQVTRIFTNKRFANIITGLKYFVFQFNFIINNNTQKYIMTAPKFSLGNFWL